MVQVQTHLSFKEFLRFNYGIFLKSRFVIIFAVLAAFISIVISIAYLRGDLDLSGIKIDYPTMGIFLFVIIMMPVSIYFQSKRNYYSSRDLQKPITYQFTEQGVHSNGAHFTSDNTWDMYRRVVETKLFFLLYQSDLAFNIVPKRSFNNQEQVRELRKLVMSKPGLKHKLRKD
jgi:hypothetical protein